MKRSERGFSLVEVLVAAAILLVIALGLVPLYTRSIRSNVEGFDYTHVSNFAKSRAEEYRQLPFSSPGLTVPTGQAELEVPDFYSSKEHRWMNETEWATAESGGDVALFTRTTTVRQFGVSDLTAPLDGGQPAHLKEITVAVQGSRETGHVFGGGKAIAVRVFKSQ
jgi:prepilin-type N-terminal cleavage/methylation domain-containing protein